MGRPNDLVYERKKQQPHCINDLTTQEGLRPNYSKNPTGLKDKRPNKHMEAYDLRSEKPTT